MDRTRALAADTSHRDVTDRRQPPVGYETIVASLLDRSLLERDGRPLRLLEMTHDFAQRRLLDEGERATVDAAHTRDVGSRVVEIREGDPPRCGRLMEGVAVGLLSLFGSHGFTADAAAGFGEDSVRLSCAPSR